MRNTMLLVAVAIGGLALVLSTGAADGPRKKTKAKSGLETRVPWTTSKVKGSPDPPAPYRTERAFPNLMFVEPLELTDAPGTDRLFVAERYGKILSFRNDPKARDAQLLIDVGKTIYGVAFHPNFAKNGYFYVTYVLDPTKEEAEGTRLVRYRATGVDPPRAGTESEQLLLVWPSGGHNGGCLKFGPDGFLYVATGDSSGIADLYKTGQDLSNLPGAILRVDVDHPGQGKTYGIPKDNPFIETPGARGEIWAYGLRQPWKMSFDSATGDLWTGNVGQDLWEMVLRIQRGGNYGWSVTEGSHPFRPERDRGPTPILQPIVEHDHAAFRSITGGYVYHGKRLKELVGAYIYGDYDTGRIWMLRFDRDSEKVTENRELVDSSLRLVGFGEDHAGELYLLDHVSGQISRLAPNPAKATAGFPRKLSETGLFASVRDLTPAPGLIPYSVIVPQWTDGAFKERYLALPGDSQIEFEAITYPQPAPGAPPGWKFPDGTVMVETISLEMEAGTPTSRRRLETRIQHHERLSGGEDVGDQYWQGYTYVWNDEQTEAVLLEDPRGRERTFTIRDAKAPGGKRQQTWRYPSRTECTVCHNMAAKYSLGVQTLQMNKDHDYGAVTANQLSTLEHLGILTKPLPRLPEETPRLVDAADETQDLDARARSYLHANCSHCHRKWGGGNAEFQFLATLDLAATGTIDVRPGQGNFAIANAKVIAPSDPYRSIAFYRMSTVGPGRMPRIGSNVVDEGGLRLMHDWIAQLPVGDADASARATAAERNRNTAVLIARCATTESADGRAKMIDQLLASTLAASHFAWAIDGDLFPEAVRKQVISLAVNRPEEQVRDLFERFLPEEQRTKRLGAVVDAARILALPGSISRGKKIFFEAAGVQCRKCHKIGKEGTEVGPDLSEIGKKYGRAELLETILEPSKKIEPKYLTYVVETSEGSIHTGLLVTKTEDEVVLKNAENKLIRLQADDVELLVPQQKSMMPELLLKDMTAEQVADLTAFLVSLKPKAQP